MILIYAFRRISREWAASLLIVAVMSVCIGTTAHIFSSVDEILFRGPNLLDSSGLLRVFIQRTSTGESLDASYPIFTDARTALQGVADLAAFAYRPAYLTAQGSQVDSVLVGIVSDNYFEVLGVHPSIGKLLAASNPAYGPDVAVLSWSGWTKYFGRQSTVLGKELMLNGKGFTVIGVTPPGFKGTSVEYEPDMWVPLERAAVIEPILQHEMLDRATTWLELVGRPMPGLSRRELDTRLESRSSALALPRIENYDVRLVFRHLSDVRNPSVVKASWLALGTAMVMLFAGTFDAAGILVARALGRRKTFAIQIALGAGREQLIAEWAIEGLVLLAVAVIGGGLVAIAATSLHWRLFSIVQPEYQVPHRTAFFLLVPCLVTLALFTAAPALQTLRSDVLSTIREQGAVSARKVGVNYRFPLVAMQICGATAVLVVCGFFLDSLRQVASLKLGFNPDNMVVAPLDLARQGVDKSNSLRLVKEVLAGLSTVPGIRSVAAATSAPLQWTMRTSISVQQQPRAVNLNMVTPQYFEATGIPLMLGRDFDSAESSPVAIVSKQFADVCWPHDSPIGKIITNFGPNDVSLYVVGLANDVKGKDLTQDPVPTLYVPLSQFLHVFSWRPPLSIVVRTGLDSADVLPSLLKSVQTSDPGIPLARVESARAPIERFEREQKSLLYLLCVASISILLLAVAGIVGVLSYLVEARIQEVGIRVALGASRYSIAWLIYKEGMQICIAGTSAGIVMGFWGARAFANTLYGFHPSDPWIYSGSAAIALAATTVASLYPTLRALRIKPIAAIRK